MRSILKIGSHTFPLTNQHKILFPGDGFTKNDLLVYYAKVAPLMLPFIENHMIAMQRFPDGILHTGFFQKNADSYFPSWIENKIIYSAERKKVRYVLINNTETLLYLVNQGCVTPHIWLSTAASIRKPDRMIFDLDPAGTIKFSRVRWLARQLKLYFEKDNLASFVMTTGSRGLHVVVPLRAQMVFDMVRAYARNVAQYFVEKYPQYVTLEMNTVNRGNKIFLDVLRNSFGATSVAPYAVRALPGAPIATPILWSELSVTTPQKYTIKNIHRRIARVGDVWQDFYQTAGKLSSLLAEK